jgi:hypothetical protein
MSVTGIAVRVTANSAHLHRLFGIQTAEHPENVAALNDHLAVSPLEVRHEDIWPGEVTAAEKVEGSNESDGKANNSGDGRRNKVTGLSGDPKRLSSGNAPHSTSDA